MGAEREEVSESSQLRRRNVRIGDASDFTGCTIRLRT